MSVGQDYIEKKKREETQGIVVFGSDGYYLKIPEGETIRLPSSDQLFECIYGKFSSAKPDISPDISEEILTKYLDKRYETNSIEKIIEFSKNPGN